MLDPLERARLDDRLLERCDLRGIQSRVADQLVGSRRNGPLTVPAVFIQDGEPIGSLRGTLFVLHDAGFTDDEAIDWLLTSEESIGLPPIEALRAGRKSEVRRVAQALG